MTLDSQGGLGTTPPPDLGDEPSPDPYGTAEGHHAPGASIGLWIVVAAVIAASAIIALLVS